VDGVPQEDHTGAASLNPFDNEDDEENVAQDEK
jgi:hypothetical protein